jgi:tetratricopeptide (TPR) repeat protein
VLMLVSCTSRPPTTITFLDHINAGDAAYIKGDYAVAEHHYKTALVLAEERNSENSLVEIALHSLGENYFIQKKFDEAERVYLRAIQVAEKLHGSSSPDMLSPLSDITVLYINWGRFADAKNYNDRALSISRKLSNGDHKEDVAYTESLREWIAKGK